MDQDDDNDQKGKDDHEDENEDQRLKSYSKKGFFGKSNNRQLKLLNLKVFYKPRISFLRDFKIQAEAAKPKLANRFASNMRLQLQHKKVIESFKSTTKASINVRNYSQIQNHDINSVLKFKYLANSVQIITKLKKQNEFSNNIALTLNWWQKFKMVYGIQLQKKNDKDLCYGGKIKLQYTRNINQFKYFNSLKQYNELLSLNLIKKANSKKSIELQYKSNFITQQGRKFYLEHKSNLDPFARNYIEHPVHHNYTFNAQDSIGMFTLNSSISLQNLHLKSKEVRFFIEYDKKYRIGLQRKNQSYEVMFQLYKLNYKMFKSFHFYAGGKNFLGIFKGKINLFKTYYNYDFSIKFKPGGGSFYKDFSYGLNVKWNL